MREITLCAMADDSGDHMSAAVALGTGNKGFLKNIWLQILVYFDDNGIQPLAEYEHDNKVTLAENDLF